MKIITACLLSLGLSFQSCTRSADDLTQPPVQVQAVSAGTWKVSLFTDSGADETHKFTGYSFQFNNDGTMTAASGPLSKAGTWKVESSSRKFIIDLGDKAEGNKPLGELTDDWRIVSITAAEIKLRDDNPASAEFLTFVKN
ncbi:MAG: hypothetical protein M3Q06_10910 [Bacteroidota bacterium]|nr:hypothetical protein [Bacteroidota bacterium]